MNATLRPLFLFDVADEILTASLDSGTKARARYLGFDPPPLVVETQNARVAIFDFGVVSVTLAIPFAGQWQGLAHEVSRILDDGEIHSRARAVAQEVMKMKELKTVNAYDGEWLSEDYLIIEQTELATDRSNEIAALVRGESQLLSESETREVMSSALSCYPHDLLVAGWASAYVADTPEGAQATLQLLEFANAQLLELRHYDRRLQDLLTRLTGLQSRKRIWWWGRWSTVREAERLNEMRLDVMTLMERSDNSLRVLGDMFYARAYRVVSQRIGVDDYRKLLEEKLKIAGECYQFLVEEFNHARAFLLEAVVVAILVIELAMALMKIH